MLNAIANPLKIGLYEEDVLIESLEAKSQASEDLPLLLERILANFELVRLIYANGPGSYMGIKLSFVSLKTLSIVLNLPLFAVSAFELNNFTPIRANKALCFVYENGEISLRDEKAGEFFLPKNLKELNLSQNNEPFYFLDAL